MYKKTYHENHPDVNLKISSKWQKNHLENIDCSNIDINKAGLEKINFFFLNTQSSWVKLNFP